MVGDRGGHSEAKEQPGETTANAAFAGPPKRYRDKCAHHLDQPPATGGEERGAQQTTGRT